MNGTELKAAQKLRFATVPGVHKVEMIMDGFDPVANEVEVSDGQTTTVRAGQP